LNFGQIREAVLGRIARAEGTPIISPAYRAPDASHIRERLKKAGLPASGMETLMLDGKELGRPSTVGWVYWGKLFHLSKDKMRASTHPDKSCMLSAEMEYHALRDIGAYENILEYFNLRSVNHKDALQLADRVALTSPQPSSIPTPAFEGLANRLRVGGVQTDFNEGKLSFCFGPPRGPIIELARPLPHPWRRDRELTEIGVSAESDEYEALESANVKAKRMIGGNMPESLVQSALAQLRDALEAFFESLVLKGHLSIRGKSTFSGKAVLSVGPELHLDQLGLAEEIAWKLFGPNVSREMGNRQEVAERTEKATKVLDGIMARSWVILNRAPTFMPTALLAFHPIRYPDRVFRINPLVCLAMNADFDGDQAAVYLPLTEAAQEEAGELLSVAGHIKREPELLRLFCPTHEAVWGLADLSRSPDGYREIEELAGIPIAAPEGYVTRNTIATALYAMRDRDGVEAALRTSELLMNRGFKAAKASGASISPFIGEDLVVPPAPEADSPQDWLDYAEACAERIASRSDFENGDIGPQILSIRSGARGNLQWLACLIGPRGAVVGMRTQPRHIIRNGLSDGMSSDEVNACVVGARSGLAKVALNYAARGYELRGPSIPKGFSVLSRAMRAENPGMVFANAAAAAEVDPLQDVDSRLFVGLKPL